MKNAWEKLIEGITLLSIDEYKEAGKAIPPINFRWWLRSKDYDRGVYSVRMMGNVPCIWADAPDSDMVVGVRPVLVLKPAGLKIGEHFSYKGYHWTYIGKNRAICATTMTRMAFRADSGAPDADDYEKSDVRDYLMNWLFGNVGKLYRCTWDNGYDDLVLDIGKWSTEKWERVIYASPCETIGTFCGLEWNPETGKNEAFETPVLRRDVHYVMVDGEIQSLDGIIPKSNVCTCDVAIGAERIDGAKELDIEILDRGEETGRVLGFLGLDDNELIGREAFTDGNGELFEKRHIEVLHVFTHDGMYHHFWKINGNKAVDGHGRTIG